MITLKEALKLSNDEICELRKDLSAKIRAKNELGAYIEQLNGENLNESGDGIPIAIKDNIQVKGWNISCASKILQGYIAPYDASAIVNLRSHGCAPFGRTNMDEFAMGGSTESSFYGKTLNPLDHTRVPGGSSGGSAAAVGGGIAVAALGSDTGGSIRQPAAFCGCVGFKPSYGRVSRYGLGAYSSSLDQIGPITQNVEDAAILYDMIAGFDEKDSTSYRGDYTPVAPNLDGEKKLAIAVIDNFIDKTNDDVKSALLANIEKLKSFGHKIIHKNLASSKYAVASYYIIATAEASTNLSRYDGVRYGFRADASNLKSLYASTRAQGFGEEVQRRMLLGTFVLSSGYYDAYYIKAQKVRAYIKAEYEKILSEADLIYMPVAPSVAYKIGSIKSPLESYLGDIYTIGVNLAGLPAISVPIAKNADMMNISAQLIGRAYDEKMVLEGGLNLQNLAK